MSSKIKLHILPVSVSCLPLVALCEEAGVEYETSVPDMMNGGHKTPEYLALNPMHCVPTMEDGDFSMWEGRAIGRYICNKNSLEQFYPSEPKKRAVIDMMLDFHNGVWYEKITKRVLYPPNGWAPAPSAEDLAAAEKGLHEDYWPTIDKVIKATGGKMMGGDSPNLADIFFVLHLNYTQICCPNSFVSKHEGLMSYKDAVKAKLTKWSNWSPPADGYFASKKVE